jgi:hypothetical protein
VYFAPSPEGNYRDVDYQFEICHDSDHRPDDDDSEPRSRDIRRAAAEPRLLSPCVADRRAAFEPCNADGSFRDTRRIYGRRKRESSERSANSYIQFDRRRIRGQVRGYLWCLTKSTASGANGWNSFPSGIVGRFSTKLIGWFGYAIYSGGIPAVLTAYAFFRGHPTILLVSAGALAATLFIAVISWIHILRQKTHREAKSATNETQVPRIWIVVAIAVVLLAWLPTIISLTYPKWLQEPARRSVARSESIMSGLMQGYGSCVADIDGLKLAAWQHQYEVALICGVNNSTTDRYEAESISVSALHPIRPESITMYADKRPQMVHAIGDMAHDQVKNTTLPPGELAAARIPIWNEIALLPTGFDIARIHSLNDVYQNGGKIMSREFPGCHGCHGRFIEIDLPLQK